MVNRFSAPGCIPGLIHYSKFAQLHVGISVSNLIEPKVHFDFLILDHE